MSTTPGAGPEANGSVSPEAGATGPVPGQPSELGFDGGTGRKVGNLPVGKYQQTIETGQRTSDALAEQPNIGTLSPEQAREILARYPSQEALDAAVQRGDTEAISLDRAYGERTRRGGAAIHQSETDQARFARQLREAMARAARPVLNDQNQWEWRYPDEQEVQAFLRDLNVAEQRKGLAEKPTNDADALKAARGTPTGGLFEKPENDKLGEELAKNLARMGASVEGVGYIANLTPEQREEMVRGSRESVKNALGIQDTAELGSEARKVMETLEDWLRGKISR